MRRKNWINKKKHFFDNQYLWDFFIKKKLKTLDKHRSSEYLFKIFLAKNKYKQNFTDMNIFFFKFFLVFFKFFQKKKLINLFYNKADLYYNQYTILSPSYFFSSQFFEYKTIFFNILKKHNYRGFFIYKNLFKQSNNYNLYKLNKNLISGYNFYLLNSTKNVFEKLNNIFIDKEFRKVGSIKLIINNTNNNFDFNYFINYNLYLLNILEIYKICLYLNLKILTKNN